MYCVCPRPFVFSLADDSIPSNNILPLAYNIKIIHNATARWRTSCQMIQIK